jgi:hypothetical protein
MFKLHDIDSNQMFTSLGLRVSVISCDKKQCCVHNSSTSKHSCHEGIVTGTIDKGDVSHEDEIRGATLVGALNLVRVR